MILSPNEYASSSVYDLLGAAAKGQVGLDHRYLHAVLDRGEAAIPDIVKFGLEDREEGQEDFDLEILMLLRALPSPQAIPMLKEYARRFDFEFPEELTNAFFALGPAAVEPLLELADEADDPFDVRSALANLGVRDERILKVLLAELEEDAAGGAVSLSMYGDPAAIPALESAASTAPDEWTRGEIRKTIDALKEGTPATVPEPFDIWEEYPKEYDPDFSALSEKELLEFLASPEASYRRGAVGTLAQHDLSPKLRSRMFAMARTDADAEVRGACWAALEDAVDDKEIYPALMAKLTDEDAPFEERVGPAIALAPLSDDPVITAALEEFYTHPEIRARALLAMWRSRNQHFERFFPQHLDDPDQDIRTQAIMGVGWLGIRSQLSKLQEFFTDEEYRDIALYAYAMAAPAELTAPSLRKLIEKIEELAGGLGEDDEETVHQALDTRLMINGKDPIFTSHEHHEHGPGCGHDHHHDDEPAQAVSSKVGRNEPCPCGSGKKFKKCCGQ